MGRKNDNITLTNLETRARNLKKVKYIADTILANACYHDKEMEMQLMVAEKSGNLTEEEKTVICQAWEYRYKTAQGMIKDLMECLNNEKKL
jgi:hypothetical protein